MNNWIEWMRADYESAMCPCRKWRRRFTFYSLTVCITAIICSGALLVAAEFALDPFVTIAVVTSVLGLVLVLVEARKSDSFITLLSLVVAVIALSMTILPKFSAP